MIINLPTFKHRKHISISNEIRNELETPTLTIADRLVSRIVTGLNFLHGTDIINNELVDLVYLGNNSVSVDARAADSEMCNQKEWEQVNISALSGKAARMRS